MKCPKCNYVSHDYLDTCRNAKCGIDLIDFKAQMQLHVIQAGSLSLLSVMGGSAEAYSATDTMSDSIFDSQMLAGSDESGDFDISLDDDLSLAPMSIAIDESAEISGIFNRPDFNLDALDDGDTAGDNSHGAGSVGPPTSGYATVMLDVGSMADPEPSQVDDGETTPPHADLSLDLNNLDGTLEDGTLEPTIDPLADADFTSASVPESDVIPWQDDDPAPGLPAESAEIDLFGNESVSAFDVNEAELLPVDTDDFDLPALSPEENAPSAAYTPQNGLTDSTEAAFADFLPPQSEEIDIDSLTPHLDVQPDDVDAETDVNSATLTDDVFELPTPTTQEVTLVDTQEAPLVDQLAASETAHDAESAPHDNTAFEMPHPSNDDDLDLDDLELYDATVVDETNSQTLTDDAFELPAPPAQEVTLVDTQDDDSPSAASQPAVTASIPLQDDAFELPPPPNTDEMALAAPYDATVVDETNSPTLADEALELPAPPTQEVTLVDTQSEPPVDTASIPLQDDAFELPPPPNTDELTFSDPNAGPKADEPTSHTLADEVFELPPLPEQGAIGINPSEETIVDDMNSQTLTDDQFELPPLPTQELTLVDTQDATAIPEELDLDADEDNEDNRAV